MGKTYPNVEFDVFIRDNFDIKANGGDCCDALIHLQFIQNGCRVRWKI